MSKFKVSLTVTWVAMGEIEIEADDESDARYQAETYHDGMRSFDAEEDDVEIHSIECIDPVEPDSDDPPSSDLPVTKAQMILPGAEAHLARFRWAS